MLKIDGVQYDVKTEVQRVSEMTGSEISGELLDGSFFNDVLGTYLKYSVTFKYPLWNQDKYAAIYEALTAPVDGHAFVMPYNTGTIAITARVESVSDRWVERDSGRSYWEACQFSIIANHPSKELSLGEVIARGRTPLPEFASVDIGDAYEYTASGWVKLPDADNTSY